MPPCVPESSERGSAVVEFTFLGTLLLVPVVYLILAVGQVQAGSFAVAGAADQAAKVYVESSNPTEAETRARLAADRAAADFGFDPRLLRLQAGCGGDCAEGAPTVTVHAVMDVPLPLIPQFGGRDYSFATVESTSTQPVGRFR